MAMPAELAQLTTTSLIETLEQYRNEIRDLVAPLTEADFWERPVEPGNSVGHLVLHLTGNLNHFIGAQVGATGYVREREREFTETNHPPKAEAMARLDEAVATFRHIVAQQSATELLGKHPEARFGTVLNALVRVVSHFALHRGQISYLVRLVRPEA
jgi:uncharacterized damage-inducible protein DinB